MFVMSIKVFVFNFGKVLCVVRLGCDLLQEDFYEVFGCMYISCFENNGVEFLLIKVVQLVQVMGMYLLILFMFVFCSKGLLVEVEWLFVGVKEEIVFFEDL